MAQHIEVRDEKVSKVLQRIGKSIELEARRGKIFATSMKWQRLSDLTGDKKDWNIFLTTRYIGKGIVYGDTRGTFEVHLDNNGNAEHIFLVA